MQEENNLSELRIRGVNKKVHNELKNISYNSSIDMTTLLKPIVRKIADSYPDYLKKDPIKNKHKDDGAINIIGISNKVKKDIENISENLNVSVSSLLKSNMPEIIENYPAHLRKPKPKD